VGKITSALLGNFTSALTLPTSHRRVSDDYPVGRTIGPRNLRSRRGCRYVVSHRWTTQLHCNRLHLDLYRNRRRAGAAPCGARAALGGSRGAWPGGLCAPDARQVHPVAPDWILRPSEEAKPLRLHLAKNIHTKRPQLGVTHRNASPLNARR
jgi:hypothetical protein